MIEPDTFQKLIDAEPRVVFELAETVFQALMANPNIKKCSQDKMLIACSMLHCGNSMLEECGCHIETTISNPEFTAPVKYLTGIDGMGKFFQ